MTPTDDQERRREARLSPGDLECDVQGARFAHVLGVTIGGHGMRVMTDQRLPSGDVVHLVIHLPNEEDLHFRGKVVWNEEKDFEFTRRYVSGLQFVNPDTLACDRLHAFVEDFLAQEHPERSSQTSQG